MPAVQTQQTQEWINKAAVAARLKISERTANELHAKIKSEKRRDPDSNQLVWMFHAGDVERYAFERDNPPILNKIGSVQALQPALPAVDYNQTGNGQQTGNERAMNGQSLISPAVQISLPPLQQATPTQQMQPQIVANKPQYEFVSVVQPASAPRPWLTLDEAAEFSGLTKRWLLDQAVRWVEKGEGFQLMGIRDMGKHAPGGRWRFHRGDLEKP